MAQASACCCAMSADPWKDPDPKPGDFDVDLAKLDPRYIEHHEGDTDAKLIVLIGVQGEDAKRLERTSEARGKKAADVVAELIRAAERSPA
jgi:hypothetical protein